MLLFSNPIHPSNPINSIHHNQWVVLGEIDAMGFWHIMLGFWEHSSTLRLYIKSCIYIYIYKYMFYFFFDLCKLFALIGILFHCGPHSISFLFPNSSYPNKPKNPPHDLLLFRLPLCLLALWASSYSFLACDFFTYICYAASCTTTRA